MPSSRGIEAACLTSPALAAGFFTTGATRDTPHVVYRGEYSQCIITVEHNLKKVWIAV